MWEEFRSQTAVSMIYDSQIVVTLLDDYWQSSSKKEVEHQEIGNPVSLLFVR